MIVGEPRRVVPGPGLPADLPIGRANNNLDVARHDGRLFLAFRTAPTHYASADALIHVVVSDDGGHHWIRDHTITMARDIREPRLVSWRGDLLLYWFSAGTTGTKFEPDRIWVSERLAAGTWSEPTAISPPDCVVWRVRPVGDRLLMTLYRGASSLYTAHPIPLTVELWASPDGRTWSVADPTRPVVHVGGSEAEIIELDDGRLLAVVRKEGPEGGWGSDIAAASADGVARWRFRPDPRKFDSPLLFVDTGRPFLVARRQVAFGGRFDLGLTFLSDLARTKVDQVAYALTPKRTAVYEVDPDTLTATWQGDLPSAGDTAFAAEVPLDEAGAYLVFNYSSPTRHAHWPWIIGQLNPTHIYAVKVRLPPPSTPGPTVIHQLRAASTIS